MATNFNSITNDGYFNPVGYANEHKSELDDYRRKQAVNKMAFLKGERSGIMSPAGAQAMGAESAAGMIPGSASAAGFGGGGRGGGGGGFSGMGSPTARIGNRGGVMAPGSPDALQANGRSGMGTLTDFQASRTIDPATGLPLNPSSMDKFRERQYNEHGGLGGFQRQAHMDNFYQGLDEQDPFLAGGARQALLQQNAMRNALGGAAAPPGGGVSFGPNYEGIDGREDGGPFGRIKPYLVGEEGPELALYEDGESEVIGAAGPEIRVFPKPGKVIPNDEITPLREGGEFNAATGFPRYPKDPYNPEQGTGLTAEDQMAPFNRFWYGDQPDRQPFPTIANGQTPQEMLQTGAPSRNPIAEILARKQAEIQALSEEEKLARGFAYKQPEVTTQSQPAVAPLGANPTGMDFFGRTPEEDAAVTATAKSRLARLNPFAAVGSSYGMAPSFSGFGDVFSRAINQQMYGSSPTPNIASGQPYAGVPMADPFGINYNAMSALPKFLGPANPAAQSGVVNDVVTPEREAGLERLRSIGRNSTVRNRMANIPDVRQLSQLTDANQEFLTPYGKIGVSHGLPKKEVAALPDMLKGEYQTQKKATDAQDAKQRAANERAFKLNLPIRRV